MTCPLCWRVLAVASGDVGLGLVGLLPGRESVCGERQGRAAGLGRSERGLQCAGIVCGVGPRAAGSGARGEYGEAIEDVAADTLSRGVGVAEQIG